MFRFLEKEQAVAYGSDPVLEGMEVYARLHDGEEVQLSLTAVENKADGVRLAFSDDARKITTHVDLAVADVAVFVRAVIVNKELFRDRLTFAPLGGVVIRVRALPGIAGLMANYQHKDWWTRPHFDKDIRTLPSRALSLLWKTDRTYFHLLPICGNQFRTDMGGESGDVEGTFGPSGRRRNGRAIRLRRSGIYLQSIADSLKVRSPSKSTTAED